jgi:hypothetical protein
MAACGTAEAVPLSKTRQIRRFWLRQNDEQEQTKTNTEILATPE